MELFVVVVWMLGDGRNTRERGDGDGDGGKFHAAYTDASRAYRTPAPWFIFMFLADGGTGSSYSVQATVFKYAYVFYFPFFLFSFFSLTDLVGTSEMPPTRETSCILISSPWPISNISLCQTGASSIQLETRIPRNKSLFSLCLPKGIFHH